MRSMGHLSICALGRSMSISPMLDGADEHEGTADDWDRTMMRIKDSAVLCVGRSCGE